VRLLPRKRDSLAIVSTEINAPEIGVSTLCNHMYHEHDWTK